jgi:hypothetical protein
MHLRHNVPPETLEKAMPDAVSMSWAAALNSTSNIYSSTQTYIRQLESVVAGWADGVGVLQPVAAYPLMPLVLMYAEMAKVAGQAELELMGASGGARAAAGGYAYLEGKDRGEDTT